LTINRRWDIANGVKLVILVNGVLEINNEIHVTVGSFLIFIVKGNSGTQEGIRIQGVIGDKFAVPRSHIEGIYITDQKIKTNYDDDQSGNRLVLSGNFYGLQGFELHRDLKADNDITPAELFIFRPDFIVNMPEVLFSSSYSWQEIVP
jgi:hypothetical protein